MNIPAALELVKNHLKKPYLLSTTIHWSSRLITVAQHIILFFLPMGHFLTASEWKAHRTMELPVTHCKKMKESQAVDKFPNSLASTAYKPMNHFSTFRNQQTLFFSFFRPFLYSWHKIFNPDLFSSMPILLAYQPILCQLENSQNLPRKKKIEILKFFDQL